MSVRKKLKEVDQVLITVNPDDRVPRVLALVEGHSCPLGLSGPAAQPPGQPGAEKIFVVHADTEVGRGHRIAYYAWSPSLTAVFQSFLIYQTAAR